MRELLEKINGIVWGVPGICMILCTGIYYTVRSHAAQIRLFPKALKTFLRQFSTRGVASGVSGYQALCTALAATVGTGNLAGVAGAICIGGPGAVFWMWICGILGMIIKAAEATLAVRYRKKDRLGTFVAGPMYMIEMGMGEKWKWLAVLYSFFGIVACFGVGNATQINAALDSIESVATHFQVQLPAWLRLVMGVFIAIMIISILKGGAKEIGRVAEKLVPFAAVGYLFLGVCVLIMKADMIPAAFGMIIKGAFSPKAVTGGTVGSLFLSLRTGAARGVFTNEAGMGTAAIAHGTSIVKDPIDQGMMGIMEVFIDTILICTMTALVILCSGITIPYGYDVGMKLTSDAFSAVFGSWSTVVVSLFLMLFAVATVLGWGLYGYRCAVYLFGEKIGKFYPWLQGLGVIIGALLGTGVIWTMAEIVNGLMMIPNLIALMYLSGDFFRLIKENRA